MPPRRSVWRERPDAPDKNPSRNKRAESRRARSPPPPGALAARPRSDADQGNRFAMGRDRSGVRQLGSLTQDLEPDQDTLDFMGKSVDWFKAFGA